ncbi:MAG: mycofactocin biosynthesis chaperone MftB [Candidatus Competibacteraceae bacterium]|nr:mycofactocin biosynthesis chaperone MftB [Candidatus Competibacteraceae bacterium]
MTATVEATARYRLAPGVAIRPERFGGLVYRYDNRRLYFLRSRQTVELVNRLDGRRALRDILDEFLAADPPPDAARETLLAAIGQLERLGILTRAS